MRNRRFSFAVLGLLALVLVNAGCDPAKNPVAPSGSVLTVTANPTRISLNGQSSITVVGFRPDGNPLSNGTLINLSTSLGVLAQTVIEVTGSGRASTTLSGDGTAGMAMISASLPGSSSGGEGGSAGATATVQIGETAETTPSLSITASPNTVKLGGSAQITAVARNSDGSLFGSGGNVSLRTDLGVLRSGFVGCSGSGSSSITVQTNADSEADATLCAGNQAGTATITGSIGSSAEATASVAIENQIPNLIINANPASISINGQSVITVLARDNNNVPLGAGAEIQLLASLGFLDQTTISTDSNGRAETIFRARQENDPDAAVETGTATIQAILGASVPASTTVLIRDSAASVVLVPSPRSITRGDAMITLQATVRNSQGQTIGSTVVMFEADLTGTSFQTSSGGASNGTEATNSQGIATVILLVNGDAIPATTTSFQVNATVVSEGIEIDDPQTIQIN
jgi:hypothetical protein